MSIVRKIHFYLGVLLGIPLLLSGLTGAIYAWQPEITRISYARLYAADCREDAMAPEALLAHLAEQEKREIQKLYFPERERNSYCIQYFDDDHFYFYHPVSGHELGKLLYRRGWLDVVLKIHIFSYLSFGGQFIAWASLLLAMVLCVTGIYLWIPKNRKLRASDFRLRRHQWRLPALLYKGHRLLGLYFSLLLILIALSGACFVYKAEFKLIIEKITGIAASEPETIDNPEEGELLNIHEALQIAQSHFRSYPLRNILLSNDLNKRAYISWMKEKGISGGKRDRPFIYINPLSKAITYIYTPATANKTDEVINAWIPQIHLGEWGGTWSRLINCLASISLVLLCLSGFYMLYKRKIRS